MSGFIRNAVNALFSATGAYLPGTLGQRMKDFSDAIDPAKGAALIGADGVSVSDHLKNQTGKASRKASDKFYRFNTDSTIRNLKLLAFGDSMADLKFRAVKSALRERFFQTGAFGFFDTSYSLSGTAAQITNGFAYWPSGILYSAAAGDMVTQEAQFGPLMCDTVTLYFVKEAGAGTFKVQTNDGTRWVDEVGHTNVDASNGTTEAGIITISKPLAPYSARIVGLSGTVKIIGFAFRNKSQRGVDFYQISQGGITLGAANSSVPSILNAVLSDLAPDLYFFEMKETNPALFPGDLATHQARFDAAFKAPWVYIGSTPVSSNNDNQLSQNRDIRFHAAATGQIYFDGYTPIGSYANLVDMGWQNDGVHPSDGCSNFLGDLMMHQIGFLKFERHENTLGGHKDRLLYGDHLDNPATSPVTTLNGVKLGTGGYTVGAWVNLKEGIAADICGGDNGALRLNLTVTGVPNISKQAVTQLTPASKGVQQSVWAWVVASRIGGICIYYVNGNPVSRINDSLDYTSENKMFGGINAVTGALKIREPFLMNRGLTQYEVKKIYQGWFEAVDMGPTVGESIASGSLIIGKVYEVRGSGSLTHNGITYALGERFTAANANFTVFSGAPLAVRIGLVLALGPIGTNGTWFDVSGNDRNGQANQNALVGTRNVVSGVATLVNGIATVNEPTVKPNSNIVLIRQQSNGSTAFGSLRVGTVVGSTSFQIAASMNTAPASLEAGDQSKVYWEIK